MKLKCKCGWVWEYTGKKTILATCPNCMKKVNIIKNLFLE